MEVSDERYHAWDVVIAVGFGGGLYLQWWLRLGVCKEGESPKPGACDFLPYAEEHFYGRTKDCDCSFVVYYRASFIIKGTSVHEVVAEGWHNVPLAKN